MIRQIDLAPLMACVPTTVNLSHTDWITAVAVASMRKALNDDDRGPQRDMGQDTNQLGDQTGLIGEIIGLRVAENAYSEPAYHVRHNLLAWRRTQDAPDITIEEASGEGRLQIEVKTLALEERRNGKFPRKFLMNLRGHARSKEKGVTHYLCVIVVTGGRRALVSEPISVATVDKTFTPQDEIYGQGYNRSIGDDLGPFLNTRFGAEPQRLVPSWRLLGEHQRKLSLSEVLRGDDPLAAEYLKQAAHYGDVDLVVRLRDRSDVQEMPYTLALDYIIRALRSARKHADITANLDGPLPIANASHELAALEAARLCGWPTRELKALRRLLHELATDMRLHNDPIRLEAFNTLRGDTFFGDQSPWLVT